MVAATGLSQVAKVRSRDKDTSVEWEKQIKKKHETKIVTLQVFQDVGYVDVGVEESRI